MENDYYVKFEAPKDKLIHIIWNLLLCDKTSAPSEEALVDNNIQHIICILPGPLSIPAFVHTRPYTLIEYGDTHEPTIDSATLLKYSECGNKIDAMASAAVQPRGNVLLFCNSGYQRSIPFLCYYLTRFHANEAPSIDRALDMILPHIIDKHEYTVETKQKYLGAISELFGNLATW